MQKKYRCHIAISRDADGFTAIVLNLPGAASCGDTEELAIANVREAAAGVIESYLNTVHSIPWLGIDEYAVPESSTHKVILVTV